MLLGAGFQLPRQTVHVTVQIAAVVAVQIVAVQVAAAVAAVAVQANATLAAVRTVTVLFTQQL